MQILIIKTQLRLLLLHLLLLLRTLIRPNVYIHLISHNAIVTKLNRLMEAEAIDDILRLLELKLEDNLVEVQNVELLLLLKFLRWEVGIVLLGSGVEVVVVVVGVDPFLTLLAKSRQWRRRLLLYRCGRHGHHVLGYLQCRRPLQLKHLPINPHMQYQLGLLKWRKHHILHYLELNRRLRKGIEHKYEIVVIGGVVLGL